MLKFTIVLTCLFLLGDCGPRFGGSDGTRISAYPQPPLYADATEVTKTTNGRERITTYKSMTSPDIIRQFYVSKLAEQGWEKITALTPGFELYGIGGEKSSTPFELFVAVQLARDGDTLVELRQRPSGPFGWPDE